MLALRYLNAVSLLLAICLSASLGSVSAQAQSDSDEAHAGPIKGERVSVIGGAEERTSQIMQRQAKAPPPRQHPEHELEYPDRRILPDNPDAPASARFPLGNETFVHGTQRAIHTTQNAFNGATLSDTNAVPPDSMGTVGPTQFFVFVNGRLRTFSKTGTADGVIDADPDVFFSSVMTPVTGPIVTNFTSDPQARYDRFTARWYLSIIDVPCTSADCSSTAANRWLLAVSDAASNGTISASTVWKFFFFQADSANFCDYPSLGVDVNALYVGCNMFSPTTLAGTNGYVVQKSSILGAGPIVVTKFANMATSSVAGPYSPRGVDNVSPTATEGYFVGSDFLSFSTISFRRVSNPGSASPTLSATIKVTVPTTQNPNPVEHAGNTGGSNGRLDSLDDRLYAAVARNGRLWTAHNILTTSAGVATNNTTTGRNATRWYEFQNLTTTPTLVQSGTVYDSASTRAAALQYWIPSVTVTGQGHSILGFSVAGTPMGATPGFVGRLSADPLGVMTGPPTAGAVFFGTTAAGYNPSGDSGGTSGRRWGDYSYTVVDPLDEMTVWTIQEYNQATNSYAVRVAQLKAPPPATPSCSATPLTFNGPTGDVVITGTSTGGSGFFDPGSNLPPPAIAFKHVSATMTNGIVNSVTYNSPTQLTLNITATVVGAQDVTIKNPDGQTVTATGCIDVQSSTHTVSPDVSGSGAIAPSTPQIVINGQTTSFTVTPNVGNHLVNVTGTCGGTLSGNTFTTAPISADCSVTANFAPNVLVFTTQPATITRGDVLGAVAITEEDGSGNTINDNATVDFSITACGGTLSLGSVAMVGGVAMLNSTQRFYASASGLTIAATSGLFTATSNGFSVLAGSDFLFADGFDGCRL